MTDLTQLKSLASSDTGFLFDPRSGATFTLNPPGLVVLRSLQSGQSIDATAARLAEEFDGAPVDVREDVLDFVRALKRHGLVPNDFEPAEEGAQ